jgi:hypothetical protein
VRPDCWGGAFVTVIVVGAALCLAHYHLHLQLWPMQASVIVVGAALYPGALPQLLTPPGQHRPQLLTPRLSHCVTALSYLQELMEMAKSHEGAPLIVLAHPLVGRVLWHHLETSAEGKPPVNSTDVDTVSPMPFMPGFGRVFCPDCVNDMHV